MSFLFGKKKETKAGGAAPSSRDGLPAGAANSSTPATNGLKGRERGPSTTQSPTPGSSVENSVNTVGGAHTPSPEHGPDQRGGPGQELQVCHGLSPTSYAKCHSFRAPGRRNMFIAGTRTLALLTGDAWT